MPTAAASFLAPGLLVAASPAARMALEAAGAIVVALAVGAGWMRLRQARQTRELRASEERFRLLFDNALEGVYENPPEGGFRRANPAMARILGYASPAEVLRITPEQTARIYVSPTRRAEFFAALGQGDHVADFESEIRRPDGSTAWITENVRAIRDARGQLLYLQGFVSDITARKQAERALRASEARYRALFEHSPVAMVEFDYRPTLAWFAELRAQGVGELEAWLQAHPEALNSPHGRGRVAGANAAALRLFAATSLTEGLASLDRIYTPEVLAARRATLIALWEGRSEVEGEFSINTLEGQALRIYFCWRVPRLDGQLDVEHTQLAFIDRTRVASVERELAAERERLRVTLRAMTESVFTTDRAGVIQFMNEAAGELTGWSPAAAVGRRLGEVCVLAPGGVDALALDPLWTAERPLELPRDTQVRPRRGGPRVVEGCCAPMRDGLGRPLGAVLMLRDITDRQRLETELIRASKLESIGVLAGGIAHDFNNLLAVVIGNLTLAQLDEATAAAGGRWLREAERGALRARELTQQLLTFAKGGEPLRATVALPEVVREAAEFALHGASARCDFDFAADLRAADVDRGQIGQVVQNLVLNALQAMPAGGAIRLALRNEALAAGAVGTLPAGDYVRLDFTDNGCGIAPEHLARVFEPFFTTKESGSGLGLATVYSIVQKHRGHVTVDSELGRGTTFHLWLPAAQGAAPPPPPAGETPGRMQGRVLFMDDEESIRVMTQSVLERLGFEVLTTPDGGAAVRAYVLARMNGLPFDLVIMDLTVPGAMGGADAMREILKIDPAARGIVSSGYSSDPVMANYRAHGFRGMVPKPYKLADFARTIREVLGGA